MTSRWAAYTAYAIGSCIFLVVAVHRGSPLLVAGSAAFLLGTLLLAGPELRRLVRSSGVPARDTREVRCTVEPSPRGGAAR